MGQKDCPLPPQLIQKIKKKQRISLSAGMYYNEIRCVYILSHFEAHMRTYFSCTGVTLHEHCYKLQWFSIFKKSTFLDLLFCLLGCTNHNLYLIVLKNLTAIEKGGIIDDLNKCP